MNVSVGEVLVSDPAEAWRALGFAVDDAGVCAVGTVRLRFAPSGGRGIVGWTLRGVPAATTGIDGIATRPSGEAEPEPGSHPNGVRRIDHLVLMTPHLRRTTAELAGVGLEPRRERDGELGGTPLRQVFYRLGDTILEVVGAPDTEGEGPASLWGITFEVADIDATVAYLGDRAGRVKDAVQPGRRITTLRRDAGVSVATAFISPHR